MTKTSPTQRSRTWCRDMGWEAAIVERWNSHAMIRQDLFGVFDLLCLAPGYGIVGVQVTSGANHAARMAKLQSASILGLWEAVGGIAEVHSWSKRGPRGKRKLWALRRERVSRDVLNCPETSEILDQRNAAIADLRCAYEPTEAAHA